MKEAQVILNRLLDKFENSKHLSEPNVSRRRVMLRIDKRELPEYQYEDTNKISIEFYSNEDMSYHVFQREMEEVLEDLGFQNLEIIKLDRRTMRR